MSTVVFLFLFVYSSTHLFIYLFISCLCMYNYLDINWYNQLSVYTFIHLLFTIIIIILTYGSVMPNFQNYTSSWIHTSIKDKKEKNWYIRYHKYACSFYQHKDQSSSTHISHSVSNRYEKKTIFTLKNLNFILNSWKRYNIRTRAPWSAGPSTVSTVPNSGLIRIRTRVFL